MWVARLIENKFELLGQISQAQKFIKKKEIKL